MKYKFLYILLSINQFFLLAQTIDNDENTFLMLEGDSIPTYGIPLKEVVIFQPLEFESYNDLKNYIILRRKTFKVYPYAKLSADRLIILNDRLIKITGKRKRKKYIKMLEKFIYKEFENELKKFTRSEGKILIKLVNRQTGNTAYDLIKELRTGFKALLYQTTASFFKLSLKEIFDPEKKKEDYFIEDILQRAFAEQYLEEQKSALNYNLDDLFNIWRKK
ncbi:MAG: DUF4294 domain-containing protein [Flavobacteriaceae bacterium]|nr:DUF4294 domain-containing protein [Flavobacteriaceae bacterium]